MRGGPLRAPLGGPRAAKSGWGCEAGGGGGIPQGIRKARRRCRTHSSLGVRCPQPWPRPPRTAPRQCGAAETVFAARAAPSHPAPASPAPSRSFTSCTPQPAPCSVAEPKSGAPASVLVAASEFGQHGSTSMVTAHSSTVAACSPERTLSTACPPSYTADSVAHTSSRDTCPTGVAAGLPLRMHKPLAPRGSSGAGPARACGRDGSLLQLQAASRRQQLALAGASVPGPHSLGPMGDAHSMPLASPRATVRQHRVP